MPMITFECPHCGAQYQVKDEFGGRKTVCRTCQTKLTVPTKEQSDLFELPPPIPRPEQPQQIPSSAVQTMSCPFCASEISAAAKKCKYCRETVDVALRAAEEARDAARLAGQGNVYMNAGGGSASSAASSSESKPWGSLVDGGYVRTFPHLLHGVMTFFTCGLWLPIWIIHAIVASMSHPRYDDYS